MSRNLPGTRSLARVALAATLVCGLAVPAELLAAGRPSGSRGGGGGGGQRSSAGASVRQSHVQTSRGGGVDRGSVQSASRDVNRINNVNVDKTANINVDRDVNVHDRDWEGGGRDIEGVYVGEEHAYIKGEEHRVWVGEGEIHVYEDHEGWRVAAGVATGIVIGTMIATPPPVYTTVVVSGSSYYYADGYYYAQVYSGGEVVYQVVAPPVGAVISVLPASCVDYRVGNVIYKNCGGYYYQPRGRSWVVVRL